MKQLWRNVSDNSSVGVHGYKLKCFMASLECPFPVGTFNSPMLVKIAIF